MSSFLSYFKFSEFSNIEISKQYLKLLDMSIGESNGTCCNTPIILAENPCLRLIHSLDFQSLTQFRSN